jgi:hypothetical protein
MCPRCGDAEEIDLYHIKRCQSDMPRTMATTRIDGGNYQNYVGLQERKRDTSLKLANDKNVCIFLHCEFSLAVRSARRSGKWL